MEQAKPGDHLLVIRCGKCDHPIVIAKDAATVQFAAHPEASFKVQCPNAKCMRFGQWQKLPASKLERVTVDYLH